METLSKTSEAKPAPGFGAFALRIDAFLKEHLFADIFDSDVLTHQQRELATISMLSAMRGSTTVTGTFKDGNEYRTYAK